MTNRPSNPHNATSVRVSCGATVALVALATFFLAMAWTEGRRTQAAVEPQTDAIIERLETEKQKHTDELARLDEQEKNAQARLEASRMALKNLSTPYQETVLDAFTFEDPGDEDNCPASSADYKQTQMQVCEAIKTFNREHRTLLEASKDVRDAQNLAYKLFCEDGGKLIDELDTAKKAQCVVQHHTEQLAEHVKQTQAAFDARVKQHEKQLMDMQSQMNAIADHQQALGDVFWKRRGAEASLDLTQQQLAARRHELQRQQRVSFVRHGVEFLLTLKHLALGLVSLLGAFGAALRWLHLTGRFGTLQLIDRRRNDK